tara:strand:+ start:288 stop:761 length:474 start_codon:yes stop_codon:yes gene_type:complete
MNEFKFQFNRGADKAPKAAGSLETWVPLEKNPGLNAKEKEAVFYGDAVEHLHIVKPAFLFMNSNSEIDLTTSDELDYYYVLAKLKRSPYLVLLGEEELTQKMKKQLQEVDETDVYYLDLYFSPNFGVFKPRNFLFEKVELSSIPNTMVLARKKKDVA